MRPFRFVLSIAFAMGTAACGTSSDGSIDAGAVSDAPIEPADSSIPPAKICGCKAHPCTEVALSACSTVRGCGARVHCEGTPDDCSIVKGDSCLGLQGCKPNGEDLEEPCTGAPLPCGHFTSSVACTQQLGCRWKEYCGGDAATCDSFTADECAQPGCAVTP